MKISKLLKTLTAGILDSSKKGSAMEGSVNAERLHISFFGSINAGKSSLVNAISSQEMSIVSPSPGTTTDPVRKSMELLPLGPVLLIDTPGYDDQGELGKLRVEKTKKVLGETDLAVLVLDGSKRIAPQDKDIITLFEEKNIPYLVVNNKSDLFEKKTDKIFENEISVSAKNGENIRELKEKIAELAKKINASKKVFIGNLVKENDIVILVIPTDEAAPKDRIILPQQMAVRSIIDKNALPYVCNVKTLPKALNSLKEKPALVITDSQVFSQVDKILPEEIPLTSFSILMADYKGTLKTQVEGAETINKLKDGDCVLISEGCTHHRQCGDIGSVKLPAFLKKHTGKELNFSITSGGTFPDDLSQYKLIIHCGGCMLNEREMQTRMKRAGECGIPFTNYGMAIALCSSILERSLEIFK